ncbi:hypothetical protein [Parvularcula sp. LCG005]|uniref:galactose-1-phosphate uridylyltransferase n=1 Tax=Parvularcula sp. LCG005 TaxID=3078805 RepID=UPI0029437CA5|nr:hypothetical protein [Parvularcula sp. LCG005]WOI53292.1 hypothetical protein RUI03_14190 [Parvularcula sp. LCG005]
MDVNTLQQPDGRSFHRRDHQKADGRMLYLYGYDMPKGEPRPDSLEGAGPGAELRWHPLRGEWSVYAAHRQNRTFMPSKADDPLAPTTPDGPLTEVEFSDFEVAVFQNRFASLHPDATMPEAMPPGTDGGAANGDCEVVVFSPEAEGNLGTLDQDRRRLLVSVWNDRYEAMSKRGLAYTMPFESRGAEVGVTLQHPHGQIYAFPFIPQVQKVAADAFADGYDLGAPLEDWFPTYGVERAGPLMAIVPPYARYPYEVWITGARRVAGPWEYTPEEFDAYAHLLGSVTRCYDALFGQATPTMMSLQAAPKGYDGSFHFWTQFFCLLRAPGRLKYLASVEQATSVFTVDVMPEQAAKQLREIL